MCGNLQFSKNNNLIIFLYTPMSWLRRSCVWPTKPENPI